MPILVVVGLMMIGLVASCDAALEDAVKASCRVRAPGGIGSGVCIMNEPDVIVLTNEHVVESSKTATCEFLWDTQISARVSGTVIWKNSSGNADMALIRIDPKEFRGRVPNAVMLAPPGYKYPVGTPLVWIGCAGGIEPAVIKGKIAKYSSDVMWVTPKVRSGESGSGVFDADGNYLLGLVYATNSSYGVAQATDLLHTRLHPAAIGNRFGGICKPPAPTPKPEPGKPFNAYPDLPPLPGYEPKAPGDAEARERVLALEAELADLKADLANLADLDFQINDILVDIIANEEALKDLKANLANKEQRLQALFGEDYALLKQMAADAKAAKTAADMAGVKAEDAKTSVGILTGAVLDMPADIDAAVDAKLPADLKEKLSLVGTLVARVKDAEATIKTFQTEGPVAATKAAWGILKTVGWPVGIGGGLGALLLIGVLVDIYRRIKSGGKNKLAVENAYAAAAPVVGRVAEHVKDQFDEAVESLLGEARAERLKQVGEDARAKAKEVLGRVLK